MFVTMPKGMVDINTMIAQDEEVVCKNAIVVCKKDGEMTCWFDNSKPMLMWVEDKSNEE